MPAWGSTDSTPAAVQDSLTKPTRVERLTDKRRQHWDAIIPRQAILQYAGNVGLISMGVGWDYGRHHNWETHLLLGFLPRYNSQRAKVLLTLRESYRPWGIRIGNHRQLVGRSTRADLTYNPLAIGMALNTVFSGEFWTRQPERYPAGYYWFSTRMRFHLTLGQQLTRTFTTDNVLGLHGYAAYIDIGTTELDIIYKIQNHWVPVRDILHFGVGVKLQLQ